MTIEGKDQEFVDLIKSELNKSVQNISVREQSAITQSRKKALSIRTEKKSAWIIVPAGVIASACLAMVVYNFIHMAPDRQNRIDENLDMVLVLDILDLYEDPDIYEDLEFYEWLDAYESSS